MRGCALAADLGPARDLCDPLGQLLHAAGDIDLLRTDRGACAAAKTGRRLLRLRQGLDRHDRVRGRGDADLVEHAQHLRDIDSLRAAVAAVAAGRAGDGVFHLLGEAKQAGGLFFAQRLRMVKGGEIVLHLRQIRHAAEDHGHARDLLHPPQRPGCRRRLRPHRAQLRRHAFGQIRQLAAADGLHDPDGDVVPVQQLAFFLRLLQRPVQIVELDLTELHFLPMPLQKLLQRGQTRVRGEAQMPDPAIFLLLQQIRDDVPPRVLIDPDGVFVDVVQQIEIKILHAALLQLPFEDIRHIICRRDLMAGELVRQIEALPRIVLQDLPDDSLRLAGVIGPGGIEVVDALPDGGVGHGRGQFLVDAFVLVQRQPHRAEAELRQLQILKRFVDHRAYPFLYLYIFCIQYSTFPTGFPAQKNPPAVFAAGGKDSEADDAEVLEQDLQADEDQDDAARELRLGLVLEAEQIADLQSRGGTDERRYADQTDRQRHIDVRQQRERDADGQRVDACGQRQQEHRLEAERVVAVGLFLGQALLDHARADGGQQHERDPVVKGCDVLLERRAQKKSDGRHQRLKAAEPCADDQIMPGLQPLGRKSLTDRDGERVHRQTDAQQQDFQNTHILHSLYREVLLISHRFRRKSRKKRDSRAFF